MTSPLKLRPAQHEGRFDALLFVSTDIVWWTNAAGEFTEPQPYWQAYTGQTWEEYRGCRWALSLHPDDRDDVVADWTEAVSSKQPYASHGRIWSAKHGAYRAFQTRGAPIRNEVGEIEQWLGALTDIQDSIDVFGLRRQRRREPAVASRSFRDAKANILVDFAELQSAQEAIRRSEIRYRELFEQSADGIFVASIDGRFLDVNQVGCDMVGLSHAEFLRLRFFDLVIPEEHARIPAEIAKVRGGGVHRSEWRARRKDGTVFIAELAGRLSSDGTLFGVVRDVTERRAQETRVDSLLRSLRHSEQRLQMALQAGRMAYWTWRPTVREVIASERMNDVFGLAPDDLWRDKAADYRLIHPDDRSNYRALVEASAAKGEGWRSEFRVIRPSDGEVAWLEERSDAAPDPESGELTISGLVWDVTERKRAEAALRESEERLQVLVGELQHRTRNLIGVVQAMAERTARASRSLDEFRASFAGRLAALGRVQGLLSKASGAIAFDDLLASQLSAQSDWSEGSGKVGLDGPKGVLLRPGLVQTMAMALHELTTNAVKHGALGQAGGRLDVRWRVEAGPDGGSWLAVDWKESGVAPSPGAPAAIGSGRRLIEEALPYQFGARTRFAIEADGAHCTIALPLSGHSAEEINDGPVGSS